MCLGSDESSLGSDKCPSAPPCVTNHRVGLQDTAEVAMAADEMREWYCRVRTSPALNAADILCGLAPAVAAALVANTQCLATPLTGQDRNMSPLV